MAQLPGPVHLIAKAPGSEPVRFLDPVGSTKIATGAATGVIAILDKVAGRIDAPGPEVDGHVYFGAGESGPCRELVSTDLVRLGGLPCGIQPSRSLLLRSDPVLPVVPGYEVPAGIADERDSELPHEIQDILPEPVRVGRRVARLVDAAVYRPSEVLDKRAEEARVNLADAEVRVHDDSRSFHYWYLPFLKRSAEIPV